MKKTILTTLLAAVAAITIHAQFLFRIQGGGLEKPSYMMGSCHTMPGTILDSIPEYLKAEEACQQLYVEMNLNSQQQMDEVKNAGQQATTLPDGKTIFDVLTPEQLDALNYRFKETFEVDLTDSTMKSSWNYQPFVFPSSFTMIFTLKEMVKHPELGMAGKPIDGVCITRAQERGMTIGQLDQIQSQDSLQKMRDTWMENIDAQVDSLMSFLEHFDERKQQAPTLFVFGAGHLIGKDGIVNKLREAGYQVEQIKTN
jgi:uncharacterized protein YbaP (TraB family)